MNEQAIIETLRQDVPPPAVPAAVAPPEVATDEQSSLVSDSVNELTLLKLGNQFGLISPDTATTSRLKFIYEKMVAVAPDNSYESVLRAVNEYLVRLGLTFREDRFMRLYLWLKLSQERELIDSEMENVRG